MKMLRWTFPRLCGLTGALVACGYVTNPAWAQQKGGFNSQPLVNAPQKPQSSSWLPKLPFTGSGKPAMKAPSNPADDAPAQDAAQGKSKEPADLMSLARLNERRGQADLARQMYRRELERNPNNGKAYHRLAIMSAKDERWDEANGLFMKAEQLEPNDANLLADMGYALYLQHRLEPAEMYLQRAVKISPRNQAAYNNLGIVLGVQGKFDDAFGAFKRVGTAAEAHTNMAYIHTQLGDLDQAMQHLNQALSLDPNLKIAAIELMQLDDLKKRFTPKDEPLQLAEGVDAPKDAAKLAAKDAAQDVAALPKSAMASSAASPLPRSATGRAASDRIEEIAERPARSERAGSRPASPSIAVESPRPSAQLAPWLNDAARSPAGSSVASAPAEVMSKPAENPIHAAPTVERRPLPTVAVAPLPKQTVAPARSVAELPAAAERQPVENEYVAAKNKPASETSPAGKPPREVAARPLPGKGQGAPQPAASASPAKGFINLPPTSEVAHAAEPSTNDRARNISASALTASGKPPVSPALANVAIHKEKPLAPPPAERLAPIVSPSERMQQLRAKERAEAAQHNQSHRPIASRAAGSAAGHGAASRGPGEQVATKDDNLLSLLPQSAAGMIPSVPQPANDTSNPAVMMPGRHPSMSIPRVEDMMPADAMIYQSPTSSLHPGAQSLWSPSTQPLRYLTDQSGMPAAQSGGAAGGGGAVSASGRSASLGGATAPNASALQPRSPAMPRIY